MKKNEKQREKELEVPHSNRENSIREKEPAEIAEAKCTDKKCHVHGCLRARGRIFEGAVIKKFPTRIVIEFERMIYSRKYERYYRSKTKLHARLPDCMEKQINVGDLIKIQETRPLSKIIHFVVIEKVKGKKQEVSASIKDSRKEEKK